VRETRTPRLTWRGLETWHGRDTVTLADERASNGEHKLRPTPARQSSTLPMSGDWKRSYGAASGAPRTERRGNRDATPIATAPVVDSTRFATLKVSFREGIDHLWQLPGPAPAGAETFARDDDTKSRGRPDVMFSC